MNRRIFAVLLAFLLLLSACTFQVGVVSPGGAAADASPTATVPVATATPSLTPTPTSIPTVTATPTEQPTLALNLRLGPGERLAVHNTRMFTPQAGWGIGHGQASVMDHILRTYDGGLTWAEVTPPRLLAQTTMIYNVAMAYFADLQRAWVVYQTQEPSQANAEAVIWFTTDGGLSWSSGSALNFDNLSQDSVYQSSLGFADTLHGWLMVHLGSASGQDFIAVFTSDDGGMSWKRVVDPGLNNLAMGCTKTGLAFTTPERGWLTGSCGGALPGIYFYTSADAGLTWQPVALPAPEGLPDLFARPENICGIVSISFNNSQAGRVLVQCVLPPPDTAHAWLYTTRDGGRTWVPYSVPTAYGDYDFVNAQLGWWLGAASTDATVGISLFTTVDSGLTWNPIISPGWTGAPDFVDSQNGWVIAHSGGRSALVQTVNGGQSWRELRPVAGP